MATIFSNFNQLCSFDKGVFFLISKGQYQEALWVAEEELSLSELFFGVEHSETAKVLNNLGWINDLLGNAEEAEVYYSRALQIKEKNLGQFSEELIPTLQNLASFYTAKQDYKKAEAILNRLISLVERLNMHWKIRKSVYLCQISEIKDRLDCPEISESFYWKSLSFLEANFGYNHPNVGKILTKLADLYTKSGDLQKAEYFFNRALKLLKRSFHKNHPDIKYIHKGLENIYSELNISAKIP